jgi:serine/threonine protein kinase
MTESAQLTTKVPPLCSLSSPTHPSTFPPQMDIYSFGICVLAMVIGAEPYGECGGDAEQMALLASRGVPPLGLKRIENAQCVDFIESCLRLSPEERLSVEQLSRHPFLQPSEESDDRVVSLGQSPPLASYSPPGSSSLLCRQRFPRRPPHEWTRWRTSQHCCRASC